MKSFMKVLLVVVAMLTFAGCQRIETGEIGLRKGFDKQIQKTELQPGSINQTIVGEVLVFPVKQLGFELKSLTPQTLDHTNLKDLDLQVVYNINPAAAFDLYTTKAHVMHATNEHGETFLMYNYMQTIASSAAQKAVSKFNALDVPTHRTDIETDTKALLIAKLKDEGLDTDIIVDQVNVRAATPSDQIVESATQVINAQNVLKAKQVELQTAEVEAKRQDLLSRPANIAYMHAQSELNISEGVREGKVNTVVIPHDFKGMINTK